MSDRYRGFDLNDPELRRDIAEAALGSGHYPYAEKMKKQAYKAELFELQKQLVVLQSHLLRTGKRVLCLFEGRDAAGKGGTIAVYRENLNPRHTLAVALPKPSDRESSQWYFQRYVEYLPAAGETVLFDRSWYNRSGVEKVMGFATEDEVAQFLEQVPAFEKMIVDEGIHIFKFWLSIGREMQIKRFHDRRHDPLKNWKLSPVDLKSLDLWDEYTEARNRTLRATHSAVAPWTVIEANDKRRSRLNVIRTVLGAIAFEGKDEKAIGPVDPRIAVDVGTFLRSGEND